VRDRLATRGFERGAVEGVVDALRAEGLIADAELARRLLLEENARGGAGAALLNSKLAARGIDPEAAAQVMEEEENGPSPAARALAAAERRAESLPVSLSPEGKARRLYAFLARRGFEEQDAAEAVRRVLGISADEGG
jgi:SOS response regulatory protein OraA/RecX